MDDNLEVNIGDQMHEMYRQERRELKRARRRQQNNQPSPYAVSNSRMGNEVSRTEDVMSRIFEANIWSVLPYIFKYENLPPSLGDEGMATIDMFIRRGRPIPVGGTGPDDIHIIPLGDNDQGSMITWNPSLSMLMYSGVTTGDDIGDSVLKTNDGFVYRPIDLFDPSSSANKLDYGEGLFTVFTNKSLSTLSPLYTSSNFSNIINGASGLMSDAPLISEYAKRLAEIFASHSANARNMRQSTAVFLQNHNPDMIKVVEDVLNGVPIVAVDSEVDLNKLIKPISMSDSNYLETLQSSFDYLWNQFWRMLGISSNSVNKNSGVNAFESASNMQITDMLLKSYLEPRQNAWNQLNAVFGCDVKVTLNTDIMNTIDMMSDSIKPIEDAYEAVDEANIDNVGGDE